MKHNLPVSDAKSNKTKHHCLLSEESLMLEEEDNRRVIAAEKFRTSKIS